MKTAKYSKALTVALHPDSYEQIKMITDAEQISIAELVRDAVDVALEIKKQKENEPNEQ